MSEPVRTAFQERAREQFFELLRVRYWNAENHYADSGVVDEIRPASDVVADLAECALDNYRVVRTEALNALPEPPRSPSFLRPSWRHVRNVGRLVDPDHLRLLDAAVEDWAERWNVNAEWCVDVAIRTLDLWSRSPAALERFEWMHRNTAFTVDRVNFSIKDWSRMDPLADHIKAAKAALLKQFDRYEKWIKTEAARDGSPTAQTRRSADEFRWTIRSQVMGRSFSEIAEGVGLDASTVKRAVESVLIHLAIPRRRHDIGRPAGSTNRHTVRRPR